MADYIEREVALGIVKRTSGDYATAFSEISRLPASNVRKDVQGEWRYDEFGCYCTICYEYAVEIDNIPRKTVYCPECGARMEV